LFNELDCAHYWNMIPSEYYACSPDDKANMMAHFMAHNEMDAVDAYDIEKERDKQKPKRGKR